MSELPVIVVSDVHLGAVPPETEQKFREFLRHLPSTASRLLINGDLFDFWFEYRSVIHSRHYRTLAVLRDLTETGLRVEFIGGNHDAWGGRFLEDEVGIGVLREPAELDLGGWRSLVVHGDGRGEGDLSYRLMKKIIRHPLSIGAFRLLHPDWGDRLAQLVSTTEGKRGNPEGANVQRAAALERWAVRELEARPELQVVLAGHTHTPTVVEAFPSRYYVNTGDWLNHFTYLTLGPTAAPELRRWE